MFETWSGEVPAILDLPGLIDSPVALGRRITERTVF
jgi:hypothetical protein